MNSQLTDTFVMISPDTFGFNPQTAGSNVFQHESQESEIETRNKALAEFQHAVNVLKKNDLHILVLPSRTDAVTPDAVFPNNWFSLHAGGSLVVYPMLAPNRRAERQVDALVQLLDQNAIKTKVIDFSEEEANGHILEGTGSIVLDRVHHIAYAMESVRTTKEMFEIWRLKMGYKGIFFHANGKEGMPIYHSNMMMSIGEDFAVWCPESMKNVQESNMVEESLLASGKELTTITLDQLYAFCGNILQVKNVKGEKLIIMSDQAYKAFDAVQRMRLEKHGRIISFPIPTIESVGGGSARCMLAEVFR